MDDFTDPPRLPIIDFAPFEAGGAFLPVDFTLPATVTNGQLSFVLRHVKGPVGPTISALQIVLTGSATSKPAPPEGVSAIEVK